MKILFTMILMVSLSAHSLLLSAQGVENSMPETSVDTQETDEAISLSGSIDSYFHKSFGTVEEAPRTSFSNLPGFSLGMVNLIGSYRGKKSGFVADLVVGPRGSDAVFNAPLHKNVSGSGSAHFINQMYAYYQISKKVKLNFGQFNTFLGYELIAPKNFHYSTSYLFSYGPFNHTGLWADLDLKKGWTSKVAIMNPTDYTEYNPFDSYTVGWQIGYTQPGHSGYLNMTYGDPDGKLQSSDSVGSVSMGNTLQFDFTASFNITHVFNISLNSSYRTVSPGEIMTAASREKSSRPNQGFYGMAVYQKVLFTDHFNMGLRTEYFSEFHGGVGAIGGYNSLGRSAVVGITLSANIISDNLRFIPELRLDKTTSDTFTREADSVAISHMFSFNFAVVYSVPTLEHNIRRKK